MTLPVRAYALMLQRDKGTRLRPSRAAVLATPFATAPKIHWDVRLAAVETAESGPVGFGGGATTPRDSLRNLGRLFG
jgi:hypothetical protein